MSFLLLRENRSQRPGIVSICSLGNGKTQSTICTAAGRRCRPARTVVHRLVAKLHRSASAVGTCTDAFGGIFVALYGGDAGHAAGDGDIATVSRIAAADSCSGITARGSDSAARDGDVTACLSAAADAWSTITTRSGDVAARDGDVTAIKSNSTSDAGSRAIAAGIERARALDGHGLVLWHVDAGIMRIESLHTIRAAEDDGCIALAGNAGIVVDTAVRAIDVHIIEYHRSAVGDGNLHVRGQCTSEGLAVLGGIGCTFC